MAQPLVPCHRCLGLAVPWLLSGPLPLLAFPSPPRTVSRGPGSLILGPGPGKAPLILGPRSHVYLLISSLGRGTGAWAGWALRSFRGCQCHRVHSSGPVPTARPPEPAPTPPACSAQDSAAACRGGLRQEGHPEASLVSPLRTSRETEAQRGEGMCRGPAAGEGQVGIQLCRGSSPPGELETHAALLEAAPTSPGHSGATSPVRPRARDI